MSKKAVVEIVKQPTFVERFRYRSERRRTHSSVNSSEEELAAIRVLNYTGTVTCVVSCVTTGKPYKQHPSVLVGPDCRRGVYTITFDTDETDPTVYTFKNIDIQCVKKGEICSVLTEREKCNVDPFKTGFRHKNDKKFQSAVRLCFQVLLRSTKTDTKYTPIFPIVSDIISERDVFEICDISDTTSPAAGKKKIVIFCSKAAKFDVNVRLYRQDANGCIEWEAFAPKIYVHRQAAIAFVTPAYVTDNISEPVNVYLQLIRPSDGKQTEPPINFQYVPDSSDGAFLMRKKLDKIIRSEALFQYIQRLPSEEQSRAKIGPQHVNIPPNNPNITTGNLNIPPINPDQHSNACSPRTPTTPRNFASNFFGHDQAPINATVQSVPNHPTQFDNCDIQQIGAQTAFNCQQPQINISQQLQPQIGQHFNSPNQYAQFGVPQSPNVQSMVNGQQQFWDNNPFNPSHNGFYPQNIHSTFQPSSHHHMRSHGAMLQQPAQHSRQPFQPHNYNLLTHANPGYGGNYLSSATPYCPFPTFYTTQPMYHSLQTNENASNVLHPLVNQ